MNPFQVKYSLIQVTVYLLNICEIKELKKGKRKALVSLEERGEMVPVSSKEKLV